MQTLIKSAARGLYCSVKTGTMNVCRISGKLNICILYRRPRDVFLQVRVRQQAGIFLNCGKGHV